jgi:A/G-specific adenine glycosylase
MTYKDRSSKPRRTRRPATQYSKRTLKKALLLVTQAQPQTKRYRSHPDRQREPSLFGPSAAVVRGIRRSLLAWFEEHGRHFFWRRGTTTPFALLVTEILLTKTRAELAAPIVEQVLARYPTPRKLARANVNVLARLLYPLGLHNKRAHGLVRCATMLTEELSGGIPSSIKGLMRLPHIGRYAASAIACVAYNEPIGVLDANVARIYGRMFDLPPIPQLRSAHRVWKLADRIVSPEHPKQFNWALLDIGSLICRPKNPDCQHCPLSKFCARASGLVRNRIVQ